MQNCFFFFLFGFSSSSSSRLSLSPSLPLTSSSPSQPLQLLLQRGHLFLVPVLFVGFESRKKLNEERELVRLFSRTLARSLALFFLLSSLEKEGEIKTPTAPLPQLGQALRVRPVVPGLLERKLQPVKLLPLPLERGLDDLLQVLELDDCLPLVAKARGQYLLYRALLVEFFVRVPRLAGDQGPGALPAERVREHGGEGRVAREQGVGGDDVGGRVGLAAVVRGGRPRRRRRRRRRRRPRPRRCRCCCQRSKWRRRRLLFAFSGFFGWCAEGGEEERGREEREDEDQ